MDSAILDAIQEHLGSPFMDSFMVFATHLGDLAVIWFAAAVVLIAQPKRRVYGIGVLLAIVASAVLGALVLKLIPPPLGSSFPSNHSMVSFAAAAALCCLPDKGRLATVLKAAAVAAACLIAFSRLYLYVHYPSDILVGAVIGIVVGVSAVVIAKKLVPQQPD